MTSHYRFVAFPLALVFLLLGVSLVSAQDLAAFEERVTEFTLDNGMTFLVLERHEAPVATLLTFAEVGSVDEQRGRTGLAHLFEHMAFKGTTTIGTTDAAAERKLLDQMDEIFNEIRTERLQADPNETQIQTRATQLQALQQQAHALLVPGEFQQALKQAGGADLNAGTGFDSTVYYVSLPSNKIELWMSLESDRFLDPVLREFYKEKDVVMEERRLRVESDPVGRMLEEFLGLAYKAHPYGTTIVGHMSDLEALTRAEAEAFFHRYYGPGNLTVAIVGDVDPVQIETLAEKYFGRIEARPKPDPVTTVEPAQLGERRVVLQDPSQPFVLIGYHKPNVLHSDSATLDAVTDIMGVGRTSRLYHRLVKQDRVAVYASALQGYPGNKYPGLFLFYAVPARDHTNTESLAALEDEIERLKTESVSDEELKKAKTRARADLIRSLASNNGLAQQLAYYQVITGDWRNLFKRLEKIDTVTAKDIQRVANAYFTTKNRTVGLIETESTP
ncbi:M16 family metallopeptidase [Planctomycetota bacterium]